MNIEKIIKQISVLDLMKKDFVKYLVSLKNEYPVYLEKVDKDMQILNVSIKKSKIPTINFYVIEILIKDDIYDTIHIPSNINYIKTLEYEILRKNIVNKISSFRETIKGDEYNVKFYDSIVEDIKNLKKKYLNMYKKETNIFKEDIAFLYNIKNGKNL
jgi:hypothetical protein